MHTLHMQPQRKRIDLIIESVQCTINILVPIEKKM